MAAAVADYTPARQIKRKIKRKSKPITIKLKPTTDILKWAGAHKKSKIETCPERSRRNRKLKIRRRRLVVGFALEDKNIRVRAEKKLKDKNLDMIIANTPDAISSDKSTVHVKTPHSEWIKLPFVSKTAIARRIITLLSR